ncbi:MAG: hypothetical protein M3R17_08475 [Bacteroidota bacterium]|nr:hypothetical protein [Bacteroidota bacterium]
MDYYNFLRQLQSSITKNALLDVEQSDLMHGFAEKALVNLVQRFGVHPTDDLMNFYKEVGSFQMTWRLKNNDDVSHDIIWPTKPMGIINILAIDEYIGHDESYRIQLENNDVLYYFDYYNSDSQEAVCLMSKEGVIQSNLFLYGLEIGLVDIKITIPEYIKQLIQSKGFAFWQRTLINPDGQYDAQVKYYIPQLFGTTNKTADL